MIIRKILVRIIVRIVLLLFLGISHAGCEYAVGPALTGVSRGVAYLYTNAAERTVCCNLDRMGRATLLALRKMGISVCDQSKDESERKIWAKAKDLDIVIKLQEITHKSTKIRVSARNGIMKDKATPFEIIRQSIEATEDLSQHLEVASTI